jgi:uncharacterized RDD family membrane protein YckC
VSGVAPPAGFWKRYVAYFLDAALLTLASQVLLNVVLAISGRQPPPRDWSPWLALLDRNAPPPELAFLQAMLLELLVSIAWLGTVSTVAYAAVAIPYALWFEASPRHATPGKLAIGIHVVALDGGAPTRRQVVARVLAAGLSWATLNVGHALAGWTRERRALHDYLAGTRVVLVDPADAAMPAWGKAVIALNVLGLLAVFGVSMLLGMLLALRPAY